MISLTESARSQILSALGNQQPEKTALRVEARTNGTAEFVYAMKLVGPDDQQPDDLVVEEKGFQILLDPTSARNLENATIDFEEGVLRSGFKFENPNRPEGAQLGSGPRGDLTGTTAQKVEHLINTEINGAVAAHGGRVEFLGVKEGKVYLSFGGGCHGCGMVDVTLRQGIESRIRELVPEVEEIIDLTDHSTGETPFYR